MIKKLKLAEQVCNLLKQNEVKAVANENTMSKLKLWLWWVFFLIIGFRITR
jgi:hypothetical protein